MATLREVRNRISGVKKTQKITRAMKMVAAAKLRRAQLNVMAARPYADKMKSLLVHLAAQAQEESGSLLTARNVRSVLLVVVTADRGFCGAFNANLIKAAVNRIDTEYAAIRDRGTLRLVCVGKKGLDYFSRRGYAVQDRYVGIFNKLAFADAQALAKTFVERYRSGEYDRVDVIYNEFKNVAQQRISVEQFLPVPAEAVKDEQGHHHGTDYIYEPSSAGILTALVPKFLEFQMYRILLESNAAELGARMAAMENATENANDMITALQLQYNKARQAAITKELLEVVSGAEALTAGQ